MRTLEELSQYLVGHWKFDGDFKDSSGNGNHGVPTDIVWKPTSRGMKPISSSGSYINLQTIDIGKDVTFHVVFETNRVLTSEYQYIFILGNSQYTSTSPMSLSIHDGYIRIYYNNNTIQLLDAYSVDLSKVYDICITISNSNIKLYVNGVEEDVDSVSTQIELNHKIILGNSDSAPTYRPLYGILYDFGIYNTALSASEVELLYNSTKHAYGVTPAERSFSHDVGSVLGTDENTVFATDMHTKNADGTLVDLSGNDNHGTVNGAVRSSGYFRDGMRFNGTSNYIDVGDCS